MGGKTFKKGNSFARISFRFSVIFYELPDVFKSISEFFINSLNRQRKIPEIDAKKAAAQIVKTVEKFMGFEGEFQ